MDNNYINIPENTIIIKEGEITPHMYFIISGLVTLYINYGQENECVLGVCSKQKIFGEMGLLNNTPSLYTAVAFSDVTVAKITADNFVSFIQKYPENTMILIKKIASTNAMLKVNLDMLLNELTETNKTNKRNEELKKNIAKYSANGVKKYMQTNIYDYKL